MFDPPFFRPNVIPLDLECVWPSRPDSLNSVGDLLISIFFSLELCMSLKLIFNEVYFLELTLGLCFYSLIKPSTRLIVSSKICFLT